MRSSSTALTSWQLVADDGTVTDVVVPGTVTQAVSAPDADERTWVFRTVLEDIPTAPVDLVLEGVATSYEVVLDGTLLGSGTSMFRASRFDVTSLAHKGSVLEIRCLPLATALPSERPPRARWRSRLVDDGTLRLIRTTLLGRCPGIAPGPPVVGPWRPVRLETRPAPYTIATSLDGSTGVLTTTGDGSFSCAGVTGSGELRIPDVERWWPHTHGDPVLHEVTRTLDGVTTVVGRVGFRRVVNASDSGGLDLWVNGEQVWARGAVWTPPGLLAGIPEHPLETVRLACEAGMNLLRVPGTAPYESAAFFDACDELGVMVWHDLALANLDVPHDLLDVRSELTDLLALTASRPSLVAVCGGSETAQQVAMLGLDPDLWQTDFLMSEAPALVESRCEWFASSPVSTGADLPFHSRSGVSHWFGVGGYRRPLSEARLAAVEFASECLAFANPVDGGDEWVPRDNGSTWDFADVRRHYAGLLARPDEVVVGELMEHVFGEWRRSASPNRGGLVLWLRDLQPGAGWGVLASDGTPKAPWWHLRRALAPRAVWLTDEGLDGVALHVANDTAQPWSGTLRIAIYREDGVRLEESSELVTLPPHFQLTGDVEHSLGHFVDVSYAYRFGDPSVHVVVATFDDGSLTPPQAFHFPVGRPTAPCVIGVERDGEVLLLTSDRVADGVRVMCDGLPGDSWFCLEPGAIRRVAVSGPVTISALNHSGTMIA